MAKFRKKPIVIEAVQFTGENAVEVYMFTGTALFTNYRPPTSIEIRTLEGDMTASPGDWIVKGIKGEFYPCKPDIFAATYEAVEECVRPEPTALPGPGESG